MYLAGGIIFLKRILSIFSSLTVMFRIIHLSVSLKRAFIIRLGTDNFMRIINKKRPIWKCPTSNWFQANNHSIFYYEKEVCYQAPYNKGATAQLHKIIQRNINEETKTENRGNKHID